MGWISLDGALQGISKHVKYPVPNDHQYQSQSFEWESSGAKTFIVYKEQVRNVDWKCQLNLLVDLSRDSDVAIVRNDNDIISNFDDENFSGSEQQTFSIWIYYFDGRLYYYRYVGSTGYLTYLDWGDTIDMGDGVFITIRTSPLPSFCSSDVEFKVNPKITELGDLLLVAKINDQIVPPGRIRLDNVKASISLDVTDLCNYSTSSDTQNTADAILYIDGDDTNTRYHISGSIDQYKRVKALENI